jgi:hypothetical protein
LDVLSPRMVRTIEDLAGDWHRLDERIAGLSAQNVGPRDTLSRRTSALATPSRVSWAAMLRVMPCSPRDTRAREHRNGGARRVMKQAVPSKTRCASPI